MAAEALPVRYQSYESEEQLPRIIELVERDLSEPYSIMTYRYFINKWPKLCHVALVGNEIVGCVVCKLELHGHLQRGYVGMLAVDDKHRKRGIGTQLVTLAINAMKEDGCQEVCLETELSNKGAIALYENLGFYRDKFLYRYYLNGGDAYRLKLWFDDLEYF